MALRMPPVGWVTVSLLRSIVTRPGHSPRLSLNITTELAPRSDLSGSLPARWRFASSPRTLLVTKASALLEDTTNTALNPRNADLKKGLLLRDGGFGAASPSTRSWLA